VNGLSSSFITLLAAHNKIHTIHIHKIIVLFHDCSNSSIDFVWRFQGPRYGLRLTLNVQKYENIPFLDLDSGVKARPQFSAVAWLQIMRNRCCLDLDVISLYQDSRWRPRPLNTISGFAFVDIAAFRRSKSISKPNFVDISQLMAEI